MIDGLHFAPHRFFLSRLRGTRTKEVVVYHTLLDKFELGWGILLGDARGGDATRRPVVGLTIGMAFRCLGGSAGA